MLLEVKNLNKNFLIKKRLLDKPAQCVQAVQQVSLAMNEGENLGLVGESGSGKTTLARCIIKLYAVDAGEVVFNGKNVTRMSQGQFRGLRRDIQMVFQDPYSSLDARYSIEGILKEAFHLERGLKVSTRRQRMIEVLDSVDLPQDMLGRFPHELSGGERQRVAIARALIMNPRLVILDEAVSSLDVIIQQQILRLLNKLQERYKVTYLFISHNLRVIKRICQTIAVMYQGKIVERGPTSEIFNNPLHPYTKQLLSAAINYKVLEGYEREYFNDKMTLVPKSKNHYVLEKNH